MKTLTTNNAPTINQIDELNSVKQTLEGLQEIILALIEYPNDIDKSLSVIYQSVSSASKTMNKLL